jgi:hypothetical protein
MSAVPSAWPSPTYEHDFLTLIVNGRCRSCSHAVVMAYHQGKVQRKVNGLEVCQDLGSAPTGQTMLGELATPQELGQVYEVACEFGIIFPY